MTRVCFRCDKSGDHKGEITAVFPDEKWTPSGDMNCYTHIGQHCVCSREWVINDTRPANRVEYGPLLTELKSIGYKDLKILRRMPRI